MTGVMRKTKEVACKIIAPVVFATILPMCSTIQKPLPTKINYAIESSSELQGFATMRAFAGAIIIPMACNGRFMALENLNQRMKVGGNSGQEKAEWLKREMQILYAGENFDPNDKNAMVVCSIFQNAKKLFYFYNNGTKKELVLEYIQTLQNIGFSSTAETLEHWLKNGKGEIHLFLKELPVCSK